MSRNRASAKAAGSRFERQMADYLAAEVDDRIDRRVKTGAKDKGDIGGVRLSAALTGIAGNGRVTVEVKNTSRIELGVWAAEVDAERVNDDEAVAGVIMHKRVGTADPGDQWVTMTARDLVAILTGRRGS